MGKFPNDTVEALWQWSLNGFCDSSGDVEAPTGWYCRMDIGREVVRQLFEAGDIPFGVLTDDLLGHWMLYEDSQGFVEAERFDTAPKRDRHWDRLETDYGKWDNDDLDD